MFTSLRAQANVMSNNVSATMCPRLPGPLEHLMYAQQTVLTRLGSSEIGKCNRHCFHVEHVQ